MEKVGNNIFLEISNKNSYNIDKEFFVELFQNFKKKDLLLRKESNKSFDDLVVSLVIIGDKEIKDINKEYRHKDMITDVLSFEFLVKNEFILPDGKKYLGEILISYPEATRKSKELKISLKKELAILFIHGLIHLLGYDHKDDLEEKEMKKLEKTFLKETNVFFKSI